MLEQFENLSSEEQKLLFDSVPLVAILIAGADGEIDTKEKEWAVRLTKIRAYSYHESLQGFYARVGSDFEKKLNEMIDSLPPDTEQRQEVIRQQLIKLNAILPKLDPEVAYRFYKGLTSFADHVARASGGFLRFYSISKEEKVYVELPMITPVEYVPEEGEEEEKE